MNSEMHFVFERAIVYSAAKLISVNWVTGHKPVRKKKHSSAFIKVFTDESHLSWFRFLRIIEKMRFKIKCAILIFNTSFSDLYFISTQYVFRVCKNAPLFAYLTVNFKLNNLVDI